MVDKTSLFIMSQSEFFGAKIARFFISPVRMQFSTSGYMKSIGEPIPSNLSGKIGNPSDVLGKELFPTSNKKFAKTSSPSFTRIFFVSFTLFMKATVGYFLDNSQL